MHCISKHSVIRDIIGKATVLFDLDKGQIVMGRRLKTSISETTRLVGCTNAVVVCFENSMGMGKRQFYGQRCDAVLLRIHSGAERILLRVIHHENICNSRNHQQLKQ